MPHNITDEQIEEMIERAATNGARKALADLGLHDEKAGDDMREIRSLLESWRSAKKTAMHTVVKWITTVILTAIATSVYMKVSGGK